MFLVVSEIVFFILTLLSVYILKGIRSFLNVNLTLHDIFLLVISNMWECCASGGLACGSVSDKAASRIPTDNGKT